MAINLLARRGDSMSFRNLCDRAISSMLGLGIAGIILGLGAHSVSAQSITLTAPFAFCVMNQPYPKGEYELTFISEWLMSIRNVNGGGERLFLVEPEVAIPQGVPNGSVGSAGGVTFRDVQGVRQLERVHEAGSDLSFELIGDEPPNHKLKARGGFKPASCFTEASSISGRNSTGI